MACLARTCDHFRMTTTFATALSSTRRVLPFVRALLKATGYSLAISAVVGGVWWGVHHPMLNFSEIEILGVDGQAPKHASLLGVRETILPGIHGNFFTADMAPIRVELEAVPWVQRANVRREWPNKLIASVDEYQPYATWGDAGRLLSDKGDVFIANLAEAEEHGVLPALSGPDGSEKDVMARYQQLRTWFAPLHVTPTEVHLSNRYSWHVTLNTGLVIELGRDNNPSIVQERIARLVDVYPQLTARYPSFTGVDLRYDNGLAVNTGTGTTKVPPISPTISESPPQP